MTNRPEGDGRDARNERRAAARARALRHGRKQKRRARGLRIGLPIGIAVVLLAIATVVTLVLVDSVEPAGPGPDNMANGGITIGRGLDAVGTPGRSAGPTAAATDGTADTVRISVFADYMCPTCGQFEQENDEYLEGLVRSGAATLDIHPLAVLTNRSQGTRYSLRAANAAACVADTSPDAFFAVNRALYANQPEENTPGLDDAALTRIVTGVDGVRDTSAVAKCIDDERFGAWIDEQTEAVSGGDIPGTDLTTFPGTPLVLVNGRRYDYTTPFTNDEFRTFVVTAAGSSFAQGDETATPTPTPTRSASPSPTRSATPSASPSAG